MATPKAQLSYVMIVAKLQQLCGEKSSGVLIIRGAIGQMTRVHITDGQIVALIMPEKQGREALPLLPNIQASRMDFIPGLPSSVTTPLPATDLLLAELAAQVQAPSTPRAEAPAVASSTPLDPVTRQLLIETLAQYIGPMAMLVSQKILARHQELEDIIRALAESIPEMQAARRFAADIRAKFAARTS